MLPSGSTPLVPSMAARSAVTPSPIATMSITRKVAVIVGVGPGLGAAAARRFAGAGYNVALLARRQDALNELKTEIEAGTTGAKAAAIACDVTVESSSPVGVVIYNPRFFKMGPFLSLKPDDYDQGWKVLAHGAVVVAQQFLPSMLEAGGGTIIFTGATAALRGGAGFSALSMPKFAVRSLAQSLAREFGPQGIHVAHVVVDGTINETGDDGAVISPAAIADEYVHLAQQPRSSWTHEVDLRPYKEKF
ncbi:hypothetical protein BC831DRAFT_442500 [Entophlyctis helioformis]|nr:hypothetical protein BC831DRAFT_442500 [Entophlyctis helioformis]